MNSPMFRVSGQEIQSTMRRHNVTIRELARRMKVSMRAVREARNAGRELPVALDYLEAITGEFTPAMRARLNQWRAATNR